MRAGWAWAGCVGAVMSLVVAVPAGAMRVGGIDTDGPPGATRVEGTKSDDVLVGTRGPDVIVGRAGDDVVYARAGDDTVKPGSGDDELHLGPGHDDVWSTGDGDDVVYGGRGRERVMLSKGHDRAFTGPGMDHVGVLAPYASVTVRTGAGRDNVTHDNVPLPAGAAADLGGGPGTDWIDYWNPEDYSPGDPLWECYAPTAILRGGRGADALSVLENFPAGTYRVIAGPGADNVHTAAGGAGRGVCGVGPQLPPPGRRGEG